MSSYRGRRRNNGSRGGSSMTVDSGPSNGGAQQPDPSSLATVELRNWEGGTVQDVIGFLERKTHAKITNARPSGGLITGQVPVRDMEALQRINGVRFAGASLNIKVSKPVVSTAVQILTSLLDARYDPRLEMLNFSMLMSDPVLQSHGMLDNATTATKMFQALAKLASTKTSGKVQSITLEGNNFVNGEIALHLALVFPSLQNLSLANNQIGDIHSLDMLRNRLPMLRELVLTGNPLQQQPSYQAHIQELMLMFRRLMVVDGVAVRSENDLPPFALPAPVTPTFFEDEFVGSMTPMFLANFFGLWDTNRQGLLQLYDDASLFSLCYNGSTPHATSAKKPSPAYIDLSRNLLRNSGAKARHGRMSVGQSAIRNAFNRIPASKHDLNNVAAFAIDAWKLTDVRTPGDTAIIMVVHGEFTETGNRQVLSFDRSLVVLPGPNNSYLVASDMLNIRPRSVLPKPSAVAGAHTPATPPHAAPQAPLQAPLQPSMQPSMQPSIQPPNAQPVPGGIAPGAPQPAMDPAAVVQEIMRRTNLKAEYADMCAKQANYQLEAALQLFEQFRSQLPPDAFA